MLINLFQAISHYLYDVFVLKLNWWSVVGFAGQALFSTRFVVQWLASERVGRSVVPVAFWFFSLGGGILLLIYALYKGDPVFILGQCFGLIVYVRNLHFLYLERKTVAVSTAS